MVIKLTTGKSVTDAAIALQAAARANDFGVVHVQEFTKTITMKGTEFARECLVFEVCQPQQAKTPLDRRMRISTTVGCRISIYEEGGTTKLATIKPSTLFAMFKAPHLEDVVRIMTQAAA